MWAFVRFSADAELAGTACSPNALAILGAGTLTPDHLVYNGSRAAVADSLEELPAKVRAVLGERAYPRVAFVTEDRIVTAFDLDRSARSGSGQSGVQAVQTVPTGVARVNAAALASLACYAAVLVAQYVYCLRLVGRPAGGPP